MNIAVMKWLLANRQVLVECVEIAKSWSDSLSYAAKWEIVDRIARKVVPLFTPATALALTSDEIELMDDFPAVCMSVGSECQALGFDWKLLTEVIIPIVVSILQALIARQEK